MSDIHSCTEPMTHDIYPLSLHDALPISSVAPSIWRAKSYVTTLSPMVASSARTMSSAASCQPRCSNIITPESRSERSEEHTSELQSHHDLVCRLLLEKKNPSFSIASWPC